MKAAILSGVLAALMYGSGAVAADCPPGQVKADRAKDADKVVAQAPDVDVQEDSLIIEPQAQDPSMQQDSGVGGSGSSDSQGSSTSSASSSAMPSGASQGSPGTMYMNVPYRCEPVNQNSGAGVGGSGTGGSGSEFQGNSGSIAPAQPMMQAPPPTPPPPPPQGQSESYPKSQQGSLSGESGTGGSGLAQPPPDYRPSNTQVVNVEPPKPEKEKKNKETGVTVLLGAGVEGYTGALAPQIQPGATAGVSAAIRPNSVLGVEVGYTGALNDVKSRDNTNVGVSGPDLVRNGGQAALTLAVTPGAWQPYVLGGIGVSNYHFRGGQSLGFKDDTVGNVPVGVGLRGHVGHFTADARVNYNLLFDKQFAPDISSGGGDLSGGGSYAGTLNLGGTF
ncbi:hypothetical protein JGU66_22460 [Myxococcaceae bacterium JPH2]|nr:hypothetical protein [Myxococcaceae bacterium JPH2]